MESETSKQGGARAGDTAETRTVQAPFLTEVTECAWLDFITKYEAYRALGGSQHIRTLFSSSVQEVLQELDVFSSDESEVIAAISTLFAPLTVVDAYDRFCAITMGMVDNFSVEAVL